jgi:hypothetical protein
MDPDRGRSARRVARYYAQPGTVRIIKQNLFWALLQRAADSVAGVLAPFAWALVLSASAIWRPSPWQPAVLSWQQRGCAAHGSTKAAAVVDMTADRRYL